MSGDAVFVTATVAAAGYVSGIHSGPLGSS